MRYVDRTLVTLRFHGDDLDPDEITRVLGGSPTVGVRKGGVWLTDSGKEVVSRHGSWRLKAEPRGPGDLDAQIEELFLGLTTDFASWQALADRYQGNLFCSLILASGNEGLELKPATMAAIASRGLILGLDIYGAAPLD